MLHTHIVHLMDVIHNDVMDVNIQVGMMTMDMIDLSLLHYPLPPESSHLNVSEEAVGRFDSLAETAMSSWEHLQLCGCLL